MISFFATYKLKTYITFFGYINQFQKKQMSLTLRSVSQLTTDANTAVRRQRENFKNLSNQMGSKAGSSYTLASDHNLDDVSAFFDAHSRISKQELRHRREMISARENLCPEGAEAVNLKVQLYNATVDLVTHSCQASLFLTNCMMSMPDFDDSS